MKSLSERIAETIHQIELAKSEHLKTIKELEAAFEDKKTRGIYPPPSEAACAVYACVNLGEAYAPKKIANRSICIDGDIGEVLKRL